MKAAALTRLAIDWLDRTFPDSVIVTELSVLDWGGASLDVAAVTPDRIVGVEVKGDGDSPSRLELQGLKYGLVAKEMWLLPAPSIQNKCFARRPDSWGRLELWDGAVRPYNRARKAGDAVQDHRGTYYQSVRDDSRYVPDKPWRLSEVMSPGAMCQTLWRDELYAVARKHALTSLRGITVRPLTELIIKSLPEPIIHQEMVDALRRREWRKPLPERRAA